MSGPADSIRPLPAKPNLEYERKQAKKLLAQVRSGDVAALARLRAHQPKCTAESAQLADAQFAIAREYGFLSWPRLVEYYTTLARHERSQRQIQYGPEQYEKQAEAMLQRHRRRRSFAARAFASYIPRFFGLTPEQIFDSAMTMDEARLVVARMSKYASWTELIDDAAINMRERDPWLMPDPQRRRAHDAIRDEDLAALQRIVAEDPAMITFVHRFSGGMQALMYSAVFQERESGSAAARAITDWLASQGGDLKGTLNTMLLGPGSRMRGSDTIAGTRFLLERGADPNWVAPNGYTVLEHALYRYHNGEAVDLIARQVTPRKAFWIAAGLGDVYALDEYIDRKGRLRPAARLNRPDFTALWFMPLPSMPDADDAEIIWEAFYIAALNNRLAVLDVLLDRGFPIDYTSGEMPMLHFAVGNRMLPLAEYLIRRGADVDLNMNGTARDMAEWHFLNEPTNDVCRRLLALCGGRDPETLLRIQRESRPPLTLSPELRAVLDNARGEAAGRGQQQVETHNVFVAVLRSRPFYVELLRNARTDAAVLRAALRERLDAVHTQSDEQLPFSAELDEAVRFAIRTAEASPRREHIDVIHVLRAFVQHDNGDVADTLRAAGCDMEKLRKVIVEVE